MLIPAAVDAAAGNPDWQVFTVASGVTLFIGVALALTSRTGGATLNVRQAFVMTTLVWLALTAFAALPFKFSQLDMSYTDAFFEAMSGITTTGATVVAGLDAAPPGSSCGGRCCSGWAASASSSWPSPFCPCCGSAASNCSGMESSDPSEKALPRAAQVAVWISLIYVGLTVIWAAALWLAGMSGFDAVAHAMTTIATGGYSTRDGSIGHFDSATVDVVVTLGMVVGSLPFVLYLGALQASPWRCSGIPRCSGSWWWSASSSSSSPASCGSATVSTPCARSGTAPSRGLDHDRHRLRHRRLRPVGRVHRAAVLLHHVHRRLRRFDHLRDQDLPVSGAVRLGPGPVRPSGAAPRGVCALLQPPSDSRGRNRVGAVVLLRLRRDLHGDCRRPGVFRPGLPHGRFGGRVGDFQRRSGPRSGGRPGRQLCEPAGRRQMGALGGMLLGRLELFTVMVLFTRSFWRA